MFAKHRILSVVFVICIFLSGLAAADETKIYRIGILAKRGTETCLAKWAATAEYLTEAIEGADFEIVPLDFEHIYPTVEAGEVDFIIANSSFYVNLETRYGAGRIATLKNLRQGEICTIFGGVIFTRTDGSINKLTDLKGKRFMAVKETSLGGWQMAWRELKYRGIDPHKNFADLLFGGTHDAVVYAVRDGKVDAGTVRTDTLERMAAEGKIDVDDYRVLFDHDEHISRMKHDDKHKTFSFVHSTRLYPEWPFAKTAGVPDEIAEEVAVALLSMSVDSDAAKAAKCAGWTIPHNYASVHDCLKELRIAPYEDHGKVSTAELIGQYWPWLLGAAGVILTALAVAIHTRKLNIELGKTIACRKQAQKELQRSKEFLATVLDCMTDAISIIDAHNFGIVGCNAAFSNKVGLEERQVIGKCCYKVTHNLSVPCEPPEHPCPLAETAATGDCSVAEHVHYRGDAEKTYLEISTAPIKDENGKVIQVVHASRDVTERKEAERAIRLAYEELETAHKALKGMQTQIVQSEKLASIGQLAAGVAHEMNTPVGFIASNFQTLEDYMAKIKKLLGMYDKLINEIDGSGKTDLLNKAGIVAESRRDMKIDFILEDIQELFDDSKDGLARVTDIVQNLRDFSRIDQPGSLDEYDLNGGIEATLVVATNEIKYHADVKTEFAELPTTWCHAGQINQVLLNILVNAAQAIKSQDREDRGIITIRTYPTETEVVCEICNDGPEIESDKLSKVFEPFYTTKPVGKGTGLGLSVSYDIIVRKHNGKLLVESEVGKGTRFIMRLPITKKESSDRKEIESNGQKSRTICG